MWHRLQVECKRLPPPIMAAKVWVTVEGSLAREKQRKLSSRSGRGCGMPSVLHRKKLSNKKILALHFSLFCCQNPSERESRETKKKRVKQRGSQTIFYSMTFLNKNIVHRSKVHLCTAVVWKTRISEGWEGCPVLDHPVCAGVTARGCFAEWLMQVQYECRQPINRSTYQSLEPY